MWLAEAHRRVAVLKRYIASDILGWLADVVMLTGLILVASRGSTNALPAFVALVFWQLSTKRVGGLAQTVRSERRYGTLPHIYLSGRGLASLLVSRSIVATLFDLIEVSCAAFPAAAVAMALDVKMVPGPVSAWGFLTAMAVSVIGLTGLAFLLAAASLVFKQVAVFGLALDYLMLIWSGTLDSLHLQGWLKAVSVYLPLTDSISLAKKVTDGAALADVLSQTELWRGIVVGAVYLVVGLVVFGAAERKARLAGALFIQ